MRVLGVVLMVVGASTVALAAIVAATRFKAAARGMR